MKCWSTLRLITMSLICRPGKSLNTTENIQSSRTDSPRHIQNCWRGAAPPCCGCKARGPSPPPWHGSCGGWTSASAPPSPCPPPSSPSPTACGQTSCHSSSSWPSWTVCAVAPPQTSRSGQGGQIRGLIQFRQHCQSRLNTELQKDIPKQGRSLVLCYPGNLPWITKLCGITISLLNCRIP